MRIDRTTPLNGEQLVIRDVDGQVLVHCTQEDGEWVIFKGEKRCGSFETIVLLQVWGPDNRLVFVANDGISFFVGFEDFWLGPFSSVADVTCSTETELPIVVAKSEALWRVFRNAEQVGAYMHKSEALELAKAL